MYVLLFSTSTVHATGTCGHTYIHTYMYIHTYIPTCVYILLIIYMNVYIHVLHVVQVYVFLSSQLSRKKCTTLVHSVQLYYSCSCITYYVVRSTFYVVLVLSTSTCTSTTCVPTHDM